MKQYITESQWEELSDKEKDVLNTALGLGLNKDRAFDCSCCYNCGWISYQLSIGQMIEFLGDDYYKVVWKVFAKDLCDTLWIAVKYKLKNYESI